MNAKQLMNSRSAFTVLLMTGVMLPVVVADTCDDLTLGTSAPVAWTDGLVQFKFSDNLSVEKRRYVLNAMDYWIDRSGARIRFVYEPNATVHVVNITQDGGGPYTNTVGMPEGVAILNINDFGVQYAVHELGHVLGWYHEQSRPDRGNFVDIICENVLDNSDSHAQFHIVDWERWLPGSTGPYDYRSIMHYGPCFRTTCGHCNPDDFANPSCSPLGGWTIQTLGVEGRYEMGRWTVNWISPIDAQEAQNVYGAHPANWALSATYVGNIVAGYTSGPTGSIGNPLPTFESGYINAPVGSEVFVAGEHAVGDAWLTRPMVLRSNGGTAVIKH